MAGATLPAGYVLDPDPAAAAQLPEGYVLDEAPATPSKWTDVPASFGSGVARGAAETVMAPVSLGRMASGLQDKASADLVGVLDPIVRSIFGYPQNTPEVQQQVHDAIGAETPGPIGRAQDAVRGALDDTLYAPQTTTGKYAETVGEFVPAAAVPTQAAMRLPTIAGRAGETVSRMLGNAVIPGVASEAAGELTEGTPYEQPARLAGALLGNAGTGIARSFDAPEEAVRRAVGPTAPDWDAARQLQDNSFGVRLTGPEAVTQATGGATALPNLQRVVEGSTEGRTATAPFFAARPAQVDAAVGGVLDNIAPQSNAPSTLGPRVAESADNVIDQTRQNINAQTRPLYQAAEPQIIPDAQFAPIQADPRFQAGLQRLRNNPELGPDYAHLPDNSIGVVDAVTKDMTARGEAMANQANPLYGPEQGARNTAGATRARNIARDPAQGGSPEYDQALTTQAQLRRDTLDPLQQGPLGRIAGAQGTAKAGEALLPANPMVGSHDEVLDAVTRLHNENAADTAGLTRQTLADRYSKASTTTQGGNRDYAGAKFATAIGGNDARREVLDAVLNGQNSPARAQIGELLDVLEATGRRSPVGSNTSFNTAEMKTLGGGSPISQAVDTAKSFGTSLVSKAGDAAGRARLRGNLRELADLFTDPRSVDLLRDAYERRPSRGLAEAIARTGGQVGATRARGDR